MGIKKIYYSFYTVGTQSVTNNHNICMAKVENIPYKNI